MWGTGGAASTGVVGFAQGKTRFGRVKAADVTNSYRRFDATNSQHRHKPLHLLIMCARLELPALGPRAISCSSPCAPELIWTSTATLRSYPQAPAWADLLERYTSRKFRAGGLYPRDWCASALAQAHYRWWRVCRASQTLVLLDLFSPAASSIRKLKRDELMSFRRPKTSPLPP